MATLAEIRSKYPGAYDDMSDKQLADAMYSKHYSDMPRAEFDKKVGFAAAPTQTLKAAPSRLESFIGDVKGITKQRMAEADKEIEAAKAMPFSMVNPLASLQSMGANFKGALAPAYGVGAAIGRAVDQTYGKPGSAGGEDVKYGQLAEALVPIPAEKLVAPARAGGAAIAKALGGVAPSEKMVAQKIGGSLNIGKILDAGATPAAKNVIAPVRSKLASLLEQQAQAEKAAQMLKGADNPLRQAMNDISADLSQKGIGASDTPEAKVLVSKAKEKLNPSGPVVTQASRNEIQAYKDIIDVLTPKEVQVSPKMARQPNVSIKYGPANGDLPGAAIYVQTQKPSLERIVNLRRELQESAYRPSNESGYGAIGSQTRKDLIQGLKAVEDAYTSGASAPVRENWRSMLLQQEKADELLAKKGQFATQLTELDTLSPKAASKKAKEIAGQLATGEFISQPEYAEIIKLAQTAMDAQTKSAFRKKVAGALAIGAGLKTQIGQNTVRSIGVP